MQLELRLSSPKLRYERLLEVLREQGVTATVLRGEQLTPADAGRDGETCPAVFVHLFDCDQRRLTTHIWPALQRAFDLSCAYVSVYDRGFHGCILNYAAPSRCPMTAPSIGAEVDIVAHSDGLSRWRPDEAMICRPGRLAVAISFRGPSLRVVLPQHAATTSPHDLAWMFGLAAAPRSRLLPGCDDAPRSWCLPFATAEDHADGLELATARTDLRRLPERPPGIVMPELSAAALHPDAAPAGAEIWPEPPHYVYSAAIRAWSEAIGQGAVELQCQGGTRAADGSARWLRWTPRKAAALATITNGAPTALRAAMPQARTATLRRTAASLVFEVNDELVHTTRAAPATAVARFSFEASAADVGAAVKFTSAIDDDRQQLVPTAPPEKDVIAFGTAA